MSPTWRARMLPIFVKLPAPQHGHLDPPWQLSHPLPFVLNPWCRHRYRIPKTMAHLLSETGKAPGGMVLKATGKEKSTPVTRQLDALLIPVECSLALALLCHPLPLLVQFPLPHLLLRNNLEIDPSLKQHYIVCKTTNFLVLSQLLFLSMMLSQNS